MTGHASMTRDVTRDITRAASRLDSRRTAVAEAEAALSEAVRHALAGGASAVELAELLGVSRQRVYQIRDGTR